MGKVAQMKIPLLLVGLLLLPAISEAHRTPSYHTPRSSAPRHYKSGGQVKVQKGYVRKKSGTYVAPHLKTSPDNTKANNLKQR
jgi:hypothetical protein